MRNVDRKRQSFITLLLLHRRANPGIHHDPDRAVERIQKEAHILNQPHYLALLTGRLFFLLLLVQQLVNLLFRPADIEIMFNDIPGRIDAVLLIVQTEQAPRMAFRQVRTADHLHVLRRQTEQA